ncbi:T9SS type B sorting domain-containing protein [Galbibacter sp.]|uniref:T9SS type B sorting domain-containing protein n=1 Tax=Galbibacter sp. TaxID=2918471 RepID=UPI003A8CF33D
MTRNYFTLKFYTLFACIFFAGIFAITAQVKKDFEVRYQDNIKGDITFIGNNIINRDKGKMARPNQPYNGSESNDDLNMQYIDIDGDNSTFSSSSADLDIPNMGCSKVVYAGLYWSAVYKYNEGKDEDSGREDDWNQVKFKTPGGNYTNLIAEEILFDGSDDSDFKDYSPYACYKDVTSIVQGLSNPNGEYIVANIRASSGYGETKDSSYGIRGGMSGGWSLVIIYENPTMVGKKITTFDGYAGIKSKESLDIPVKGFRTLPEGFPVNAKMGVMTLEGDRGIGGDQLGIKADGRSTFTNISNSVNPWNNFFNGSISSETNGNGGVINPNRNPNSENTLGWDVDLFEISNSNNSVIPNDETGVTLRAMSTQDKYDIFFTSFDVEIIEPDIKLAKGVYNLDNVSIQGQQVELGQYIQYTLSFDNIGNDDGANFTIRDVLPLNVDFLEEQLVLPEPIWANGVLHEITYDYDFDSNTIVFTIPDIYVEKERGGDDNVTIEQDYTIRMNVRVQPDCDKLRDACSNIISNLGYASYQGVLNNNEITNDLSILGLTGCLFEIPGSSNFLPDLSQCGSFERTLELCGETAVLTAGAGYDRYQWYKDNGSGTFEILTGETGVTYTATNIGTYKVTKETDAEDCKDFEEIIHLVYRGNTETNPLIPYADQVVTCTNDGTQLPKFFLCGTNDDRMLNVSFPDAIEFSWQKLDDSCEHTSIIDNCPTKDSSCDWNEVGTVDQYLLSGPGEYRLEVRYQNNCFNRYYFKAYENAVDPKITTENIICKTNGSIDITNVGSGYEYAIALASANFNPNSATWQDVGSFEIENPGTYNVYIRQADLDVEAGDRQPCLFKFENKVITKSNFNVTVTTTNPTCNTDKGSFSINVGDVRGWYTYVLKNGTGTADIVDKQEAVDDNHHEFNDLNPGTYTVEVTTEDGCTFSHDYTIIPPAPLTITAEVSQNVTCKEGNIQVQSEGGLTPHTYAIWSYEPAVGATAPAISYNSVNDIPAGEMQGVGQTRQIFDVKLGEQGTYSYVVFDRNNCYSFSNHVTIIVEPVMEFEVNPTDETCFDSNDGSISINMINDQKYNVSYSLDGVNFIGTPNFANLAPGEYTVIVRGEKGNRVCDFETYITIDEGVQISADSGPSSNYTCLTLGEITFSNATGGSGTFEYSIDGVTWQDSPVFGSLTEGTYTPSYRDKNSPDCIQQSDEITFDPLTPPTDIDFTMSTVQCPANNSDVSLSVTGGSGAIKYEIISPATEVKDNETNAVFEDLAAGVTYRFRVTDEKGCFYEENLTIPALTPINVVGKLISNASCVGGSDGKIQFTVSGFSVNYNYTITNDTGATVDNGIDQIGNTVDLTGLAAGKYTITVTDNTTNCTDSSEVTVEEPQTPLILSLPEVTHESCTNTGTISPGTITIIASGGWGSYTYDLYDTGGNLLVSNGTGFFSGLLAGDYTVEVSDANQCDVVSTTITIKPAIAPQLTLTANDLCYNEAVGLTITATVTTGTGSGVLSYSLNGGLTNTTGIFKDLDPGTYTVTVTDENNCKDTKSITVDPELKVSASANPISSCGTSTDVTITAVGGDGNYVYVIVPDGVTPTGFSTTNPVTITTAGEYDVYVRDHIGGAGYCEAKYDISITTDPPLTVSASNTDILCNGTTSTLTITAGGGSGNYTGYSIDGGATFQGSNVFNNLLSGNYNIVVKDSQGCDVKLFYTIVQPQELTASANVAALVECNPTQGADVRITNAQGGTAPYQYSFNGGSSYGASATEYLMPGTYELYIKDASGCFYGPMPITVEEGPEDPELGASVAYNCDGTGNITVSASPSTFDYTFQLNGGTEQSENVFNGVTPGTYDVRINYVSNLPATPSVLLVEDFGFGPNTSIPSIDSSIYCYEDQMPGGNCGSQSDINDTRINDGEYSVTQRIATDFGDWVDVRDHTGNPEGRFIAINIGGVAGMGGVIYRKPIKDFLPNQDVQVSIWGHNLMESTSNPLKGDPNIVIQLVDPSNNDAVIAEDLTGVIPKSDKWEEFTIDLNPNGHTELDLVIKTNSLVEDGNDLAIDDILVTQIPEKCPLFKDIKVIVDENQGFNAGLVGVTDVSCNALTDSKITIAVNNFGASGYEYSLDSNFATTLGNSTESILEIPVNLGPGDYTLYVRDIDNQTADPTLDCGDEIPFTIVQPDPVEVTAQITSEITCNIATATITARTATGGTPGYTYQLEDTNENAIAGYDFVTNGGNRIFDDLPIGDYVVRAKDSNGCDDITDTITISAPVDIEFEVAATACEGGIYTPGIKVEISKGNGDYLVSLSDGTGVFYPPNVDEEHHEFKNLDPGTYQVTVKDGYGCSAATKTVLVREDLDAGIDVTHIACTAGSIKVTATGGDGNYQYSFDGGASFDTVNTYEVLPGSEGTFDIEVNDGSGACIFKDSVEVKAFDAISVTTTPTQPQCHDETGSILIEISGGVGPYKIVVNDGTNDIKVEENYTATSVTYFNLPAANYTVTVTDNYGCSDNESKAIINPEELIGDLVPTITDCGAEAKDFGFDILNVPTYPGLTVQYTDNVNDPSPIWAATNEFRTYNPGDVVYPAIRTIDANGDVVCFYEFDKFLIPYPLDDLSIDIKSTDVFCDNRMLTVTVVGSKGIPGYQYTYTEDVFNFDPDNPENGWTTPTPATEAGPHEHTFTGLVPGRTYVFFVKDSTGCILQSTINVNDKITLPMVIELNYEPSCAGTNDGQISFTLTDADGTEGLYIRYELYELGNPTAIFTSPSDVPFSLPETYTIPNQLAPGDYYVKVTQHDGGGNDTCVTATENITIKEQDPITGTPEKLRDITCETPGLIVVPDIEGGGGEYTYILSSTNFDIDGDGSYDSAIDFITTTDNPMEVSIDNILDPTLKNITVDVSVKDQYGCEEYLGPVTLNISQPPVIDPVVPDNCGGNSSITINVDPSTGLAPYYYSTDGGATYGLADENVFTNLSTGTYEIMVKDSNGCTVSATEDVEIYEPLAFAKLEVTEALDCQKASDGGENAEIYFEIKGGSSVDASTNIFYSISGPDGFTTVAETPLATSTPPNSKLFTDANVAGIYTITLRDAKTSCVISRTIEVPEKVIPEILADPITTDVTCYGAADGTITVTALDNGVGPFTFKIVSSDGNPLAKDPESSNGYQATFTELVGAEVGITYEIIITAAADNACESLPIKATIYQPADLTGLKLDVNEFGCTTGNTVNMATVTATGVTGGEGGHFYEFIYDNGTPSDTTDDRTQKGVKTEFNVSNPLGGNVVVNVYDENGCSITDDIDVIAYNKLEKIETTPTNPTCMGGDGTIQVNASLDLGHTSEILEFYLYDSAGTEIEKKTITGTTETFTGLEVGSYQVKVINIDTGCELIVFEELTDPNTFDINLNVVSSAVCLGSATGEIIVELVDPTYTGGVIVYVYDQTGTVGDRSTAIKSAVGVGNTDITINQFDAGVYTVEVVQDDAPFCSQTRNFTIATPPAALTASATVTPQTCDLNDGIIEVINASGGWGGYKYYVGISPISDSNDINKYVDNPRFEGLATGTYEIWVIDQKGCPIQLPSETITEPVAITGSISVSAPNCEGLVGEIKVDNVIGGSGGPYTFQLIKDGLDFGSPKTGNTTTFTNLGAGTYEVRISDNWNCSITLTDTATLFEEISLGYDIDKVISCDVSNNNVAGEVTINANGGSGNFTYSVVFPDGTTVNNGAVSSFTGLDQVGTYTFNVVDSEGCDDAIDLELSAPVLPVIEISNQINVSCEGATDGAIKATVTSATTINPPYTYTLSGPVTATNTNGLFTDLPAGNYVVRVTSDLGCFDETNVTITEPVALDFTATVTTEFACNPSNTTALGQITVTVDPTTGTAPYLYSIDGVNYQTNNVFDVVDTGNVETYTLYVKDANGCFDTRIQSINPLPKINTVDVTPVTAITCSNPESVSVEIDGGSGEFVIELLPSGPSQTISGQVASFDLPVAGDYVFKITDTTTGCFFITEPYTVAPYDLITSIATASSPIDCYNTATGEITVEVANYTGAFTYEVYNSAGTSTSVTGTGTAPGTVTIAGVAAGNYYVEITSLETPFCPETTNTVTIKAPIKALDLSVAIVEDLSCENSAAEISASASGGWGEYEFALVNSGVIPTQADFSTMNTFTGISAGTYDVYVKDAEGCMIFETVTFVKPDPIITSATSSSIDVLCEGDYTGSITVTATGGRPDFDASVNYLYILNRLDESGAIISSAAPQESNVFYNLGAGNYSVTVTDNHGCDSDTTPVSITEPDQVIASLGLLKSNTCTTGATLRLTAVGGTGTGYEYSTSASGPWTSVGSGNSVDIDISGVITAEEAHTYYVRDSNLCISSVSNSVTLSPIRPLELTPTVVSDVSCYGDATGYIKIDVKGGLGNYKYTLIDGIRNVTLVEKQEGNTFNGLTAGVYYVQVDSEDCNEQVRVEIEQGVQLTAKSPVIVNPICTDGLGRIEVGLEGGTGEYQYAISPNLDQFQSKNVFEDLAPGTYTVIAQDSRGCNPFVFKEEIIAPPPLEAKANILNEEFCIGDGTGSFELIIQGGTPPYSTAVNTQDDDAFEQDRKVFDGLKGGETYVVFVRDANGCQQSVLVSLKDPVDLTPKAEVRVTCISNSAANEVEITLAQEGLEEVIYKLDGGADQFDNKFTNVAPGDHTVTVSYSGCEREVDFTVEPIQPLTLTVNESNLNEFTMYPGGGSAPYEYFVDGVSQGSESSYVIEVSGVYQVMIVDANGCQQIAQIPMTFTDIKIPNVFTPNGDGNNDHWPPSNYGVFYPNLVTKIYDRYGRVVAELRKGKTWDGRYNGTELPTGDYWYVMKLNGDKDDREFVGHFTLYR